MSMITGGSRGGYSPASVPKNWLRAEQDTPVDPADSVHLNAEGADEHQLAMNDLRSFARSAPAQPVCGPIPTQVELPEYTGPEVTSQAGPEFKGRAPRPAQLDVKNVAAGQNAALNARVYQGCSARSLTNKLPHFANLTGLAVTNGGNNNQCANFVSSLAQREGLRGHYNRVPDLKDALLKQHWKPVKADQAMPGDVWIKAGEGHTEFVTEGASQGGCPQTTGSNNNGVRGFQRVTTHSNTAEGQYYARPVWK